MHQNWSAASVLSILILIFISPSFFQGRFLAPVDITHYVAPYLDITTQMLPWWKLSGEIIHTGYTPHWNIYSGLGLPLLANMQSAVLFPLTWLFYFTPIRFALAAYAFLKLLMMGFFTYLYLRELKLKFPPSLLGAILFAFCNANVIWYLWPLTSVILILPLSFFLLEKYFNEKNLKWALLLTPLTAMGLFAGHPQTFFYVFCAIYGYAVFKAFSSSDIKQGTKDLIFLTLIFILGFIMSAVIVLPFLEYLRLSANLDYRSGFAENPFYLHPLLFLANLIPDFYGNTGIKNFSYLLVPNYGEMALGYIGITGLILSLFAFGKKQAKQIWFFAIASLAALALVYHAPIIYYLINKLPGFNLNYNNRLLYLFAFFISILAAFGLENLLDNKINRKRLSRTFLSFTIFAALLIIANKISTSHWQFAHNLDWGIVSLWQNALIIAFTANLIVVYLILKYLPKKSALLLLFVAVIVETTFHGMIFNKTSLPENFYPNIPALTYLQNHYSDGYYRVFTYGDNLLPNIGTWYHINELNDHDTIYLKSNKLLKAQVADYNYSPEYTFGEPNLNALRFLSVKYLLYPAQEGLLFLKSHTPGLTLAYHDNNYAILSLDDPMRRAYLVSADYISGLQNKLSELINNPQSFQTTAIQNFSLAENGNETISYNSPSSAYLVTTDNYYPGWFGVIDGKFVPVQNVNGLRTIAVPAGERTITVEYHPKNYAYGYGWKISMAALILWIGLFLFNLKKNYKNQH